MGYNDRISYSKSRKPELLPRSQMAHTFLKGKTFLGKETFYHFKDLNGLYSFLKEFIKKNEFFMLLNAYNKEKSNVARSKQNK